MKILALLTLLPCLAWATADKQPAHSPRPANSVPAPSPSPPTSPLPAEAKPLIDDFNAAAGRARLAHEQQMKEIRTGAVKKLQVLQDKFTREAKLDEAVAVRDAIRQVRGILLRLPPLTEADIGRVFLVEALGRSQGVVWGSGPYTTDSDINVAAVHSGLLKEGQREIVEVEVAQGLASYPASEKNGVTTSAWGAWPVALKIRKAP